MARSSFIGAFFVLAILSSAIATSAFDATDGVNGLRGENGGMGCAVCTIVVELLEQLSVIHSSTVEHEVDKFCNLFQDPIKATCVSFVAEYGQVIIDGLVNAQNSDDICHEIKLCTSPKIDSCYLHPINSNKVAKVRSSVKPNPHWREKHADLLQKGSKSNPWQWIMDLIDRLTKSHEPVVDIDRDLFSTMPALRGSNWRGADCNDLDKNVHPGRKTNPYPGSGVDYNCNGVRGVNNQGKEWKEVLCAGSQQRGVVVAGDSAGAHFSVPPEWLTASKINKDTYNNLYSVASNEIDFPHRSGYTGFENSTKEIPIRSMYKYMLQRNQCNHRDYQNIAVNGARSDAILKLSQSLSRNSTDHPLLFILELVGNDICTPHHTLDRMTTPPEFYNNIVAFLKDLDTRIPPGSHVPIFGVVDGRLLWNVLWNRTHPIGQPYYRVYDFLNCLGLNPCWAWLNSNETIRNAASARAAELNNVYRQIMTIFGGKFQNFDFQYYDFPAQQLIDDWTAKGGDPADLIEPVDGFHPSQLFHAMLADWLWNRLSIDHPDWLGPVNPNNAQIIQMFGNQGGY